MVPRGYWDKANLHRFKHQENNNVKNQEIKNSKKRKRENSPEECNALSEILEARYEPIEVDKVIEQQTHLSISERQVLKKVLEEKVGLFQGRRGNWKRKPVHLELVPGATPSAQRPFPIPQAYQKFVKEEVNRLVAIGLLSPVRESKWSSPSFAIPKKNKTIRFVTDFRQLNGRLVRKPFPLPLIHEIISTIHCY